MLVSLPVDTETKRIKNRATDYVQLRVDIEIPAHELLDRDMAVRLL
jgi:hypothetical protein